MAKKREKTEINRLEILRQCYVLALGKSWDGISVGELEKNIDKTRGAIFYFNKNKEDLFINMIDELFFPVFILSETEKAKLKTCMAISFFSIYRTPFERVCNDLRINYRATTPEKNLLNIISQCRIHYPDFDCKTLKALSEEVIFLKKMIGENCSLGVDPEKVLSDSIGRIFIHSFGGFMNWHYSGSLTPEAYSRFVWVGAI